MLILFCCCICWVICEILYIGLISWGIRCPLWTEFTCYIDHTYMWSVQACCRVEPWLRATLSQNFVAGCASAVPSKHGSGGPMVGH